MPPSAVVTVYEPSGVVSSAFSVERGSRLAKASAASPAQGASTAAMKAISAADRKEIDAQEQYDLKYVGFLDWGALNFRSGATTFGGVPYQGKYKRDIEGAEFYEIVGRPDLASNYRTWRDVKTGLILGGIAADIGGTVLMFMGMFKSMDTDNPFGETSFKVGLGLLGLGTVGMMTGFAINPEPVDLPERRSLADDYNARLKRGLGISSRPRLDPTLRAGFTPIPGGAGLLFSGTLQ